MLTVEIMLSIEYINFHWNDDYHPQVGCQNLCAEKLRYSLTVSFRGKSRKGKLTFSLLLLSKTVGPTYFGRHATIFPHNPSVTPIHFPYPICCSFFPASCPVSLSDLNLCLLLPSQFATVLPVLSWNCYVQHRDTHATYDTYAAV